MLRHLGSRRHKPRHGHRQRLHGQLASHRLNGTSPQRRRKLVLHDRTRRIPGSRHHRHHHAHHQVQHPAAHRSRDTQHRQQRLLHRHNRAPRTSPHRLPKEHPSRTPQRRVVRQNRHTRLQTPNQPPPPADTQSRRATRRGGTPRHPRRRRS